MCCRWLAIPLPGPLRLLRTLRAFRVFRLFKRVKSLNKIVVSLGKAMPGVMNAFLILTLVMCIYAILAVDFFQAEGRDGVFHFESGATKLDAQRGRLGAGLAVHPLQPRRVRGARVEHARAQIRADALLCSLIRSDAL